ncbi:ATP-binding protein [Parachlamydia sp. AcF125]|uniref:HAMP domain-containing sensor histidine kinase n=1 Tax=Parachlamydia sp. AcF125 TaxID=2795736 RepID=UPI001BC9D392|nr:ATP-binding protein [Parachlamydia sp. AcF125]MBS4167999.1 Sensor histidine kinase ResE [Parachlamydia sp. AcF125]
MFSFRQKILIAYIIIFLIFTALLYPFISSTVKKLVIKAMEERATELIARIKSAPDHEALVRRLKYQKSAFFFRVSVISTDHKVLYDSHTKRLLGLRFRQDYVVSHPEVLEAFKNGYGYHEAYSNLLSQKFVYIAKAFDFHGKTYVLRTAFPYYYVADLTHDFEVNFLALSTAILLLFSLMTWFIINYLTRPIEQILRIVKPFQSGQDTSIPEIQLSWSGRTDEFGQLAETLNALSAKIKNHISNLTSERKEKETILESLMEGVVAVNPNMTVTYANNKACEWLELRPEQLVGSPFSLTGQSKCYALLSACQHEKHPLTDNIQLKSRQEKLYLDVIAAPKTDNTGAILVLQDKSSHYKILEMRKDFIANASHELKTPITIIHGFAEALNDNPDLPLPVREEILGKIVRNCQRMATLIKNLLTISDIEHLPSSRLIECDLSQLVKNCIHTIKDRFPEAQMTLIKSDDILLTADIDLMEMAVLNLLENAVKYSKPPAKITLALSKIDNIAKLTIADEGIGIPAQEIEHIFERFYTVNKVHSQKMGGSGLGLSIVQTIIEKHFGKIYVASELDKGTTFTICLPIHRDIQVK